MRPTSPSGWYSYGVAFDRAGKRHNGNTPADYVAMWRHVWGVFHDAGATNVQWVWSPNLLLINSANSREQAKADYAALYPGDGFVDWIGIDGYNDGIKSRWKNFADLFGPSYDAITKISGKPLMIAEFGCTEQGAPAGASKAAWITQTYLNDIPRQFPRILLVNWFDRDKSKQGEADWRFNSSPQALEAYKAAVNDPLYQGDLPPWR
jgi:mannan endo-1,4-beta-mannosidase